MNLDFLLKDFTEERYDRIIFGIYNSNTLMIWKIVDQPVIEYKEIRDGTPESETLNELHKKWYDSCLLSVSPTSSYVREDVIAFLEKRNIELDVDFLLKDFLPEKVVKIVFHDAGKLSIWKVLAC